MMFAIYTGVVNCWPYGEIICQAQVCIQNTLGNEFRKIHTYLNTFQTVLFGALNQHFCILIMSMGLDRYFSLAYPHKYGRIFSAKVSSFFSRQHIMVFAKPQ